MRKVFATFIAVFFALSLVSVANVAAAAKEKIYSLKGEVVSVDTVAKTLTVKGKKGEETFATSEMTKINMGKKHETFENIKAGEKVLVKYYKKNGKEMAEHIRILPEHMVKAKAEKK